MGWIDSMNKKHGVVSCYSTHKPLEIGGFKIYGGSCINPPIGMDIYVGLDLGMATHESAYPWNSTCVSVRYLIEDMKVPTNVPEFKKMISWLAVELKKGKKIHIGCIGGHGRTGLVLAALVASITGNKEAISYVRTNYCYKAVESNVQVQFLMSHFGVNHIESSKGAISGTVSYMTHKKEFSGHKIQQTLEIPPDSDAPSIWGASIK